MKLGLFAINYATCGSPEVAVRVARAAEAAGFESVWTGEHVVLPDPATEASPLPPDTPMLDPVVALTLLAAHTSTIRLATGIIVLPQRNPLVLAKQLASLDVVSGGRLVVGVGTGYLEPEFAALGVPMERRGERTEDYIRAMRAIWANDRASHAGPFTTFAGVTARPHPQQPDGPAIVLGGGTYAALRRAVTLGHGWYGFGVPVDRAHAYVEALAVQADRYERPSELGRLELTITPVGPLDAPAVERFVALGIDRLVVLPQPDAAPGRRHAPVREDVIIRNIDDVAALVAELTG